MRNNDDIIKTAGHVQAIWKQSYAKQLQQRY